MTKYKILFAEDGCWRVVGDEDAASAEQAVRAVAEKVLVAGTYVAVPTRSWNPVDVQTRQVTNVVLSADSGEREPEEPGPNPESDDPSTDPNA